MILRLFLIPFSILYGIVVQIRNLLYDLKIFKINKFDKPVISIGNITAGGTGKTPFTIYLSQLLIALGKNVAVVSRGYGRLSKGFQLVSDGVENYGQTLKHGDEPVLIANLVPKAIVAVCEDRTSAIKKLLEKYKIDLILLDDGFQHRSVYREIDIVILKNDNALKDKLVLPSGLLREFKFNLKRADIIINRGPKNLNPDYFNCNFLTTELYDPMLKRQSDLIDFKGKSCIAFAGIANPLNFKANLIKQGISIVNFIFYKDHYNYSETDIHFLIRKCVKNDCIYLLCTQKDMIKIREIDRLQSILEKRGIELLATGFKVQLDDEKSFLKKIESRLDWL